MTANHEQHPDPVGAQHFVGEELPALSPSIGRAGIAECARQMWAEHRLLGNCITVSEDALKRRERGKALHNIVLEGGKKIECISESSWRSKAAKVHRDAARIAGMIPILEDSMSEIETAAYKIRESIAALGIDLADGIAEQKFHWYEASSIGEVLCSGVIDWRDGGRMFDLKTTEGSVNPLKCATNIVDGSAIIQDCAYRNAVCSENPELQGRTEMTFIFAQSCEPFMVTPVTCDGAMRHIGETRWLRAIEIWAKCLNAGTKAEHWPQHTDRPIEVHAPGWLLAQEMALEGVEQ